MKLEGKTAIVTGASQGLGKIIAAEFLSAGADVVMCARDEQLLERVHAELTGEDGNRGQRLSFLKADVSQWEDVQRLVSFALSRRGKLDILVNNAGVYGPKGCLEEVDWSKWTRAIEINLYGPMLMCRAVIPHMRRNGSGKIINISGGGATAPLPYFSAYAAAKAALVRLTETLACELGGCGIDVNAVAPGALNTRLLDEVLEAGPQKVGRDFYERSVKQKKEGGASMRKAAQLCVFLAGPESNGITGRLLSAVWDPWEKLPDYVSRLQSSEIYTLRRIVPVDRGEDWGAP